MSTRVDHPRVKMLRSNSYRSVDIGDGREVSVSIHRKRRWLTITRFYSVEEIIRKQDDLNVRGLNKKADLFQVISLDKETVLNVMNLGESELGEIAMDIVSGIPSDSFVAVNEEKRIYFTTDEENTCCHLRCYWMNQDWELKPSVRGVALTCDEFSRLLEELGGLVQDME